MSARVETDAGGEIPDADMPRWCQMWADGDRRLRIAEISLNVLGRPLAPEHGQLWERVRGRGEQP